MPKIGSITFPAGSSNVYLFALMPYFAESGELQHAVMFHPEDDNDEYGFENYRPMAHPDFVAQVDALVKTLQPLDIDEHMTQAEIEIDEPERVAQLKIDRANLPPGRTLTLIKKPKLKR